MSLHDRIFYGAGKDILKPKETGKPIIDSLNWFDYLVLTFLDGLDTKIFFKNRKVRTNKGRVTSRAERNLTRFFDKYEIRYIYEKPLVLEGRKLLPDFYLPNFNVYVEVWGLYETDVRYRKIVRLKRKLYCKYNVPVVSIYPRHLKELERIFPVLFQNITGKEFSLPKKLQKEDSGDKK